MSFIFVICLVSLLLLGLWHRKQGHSLSYASAVVELPELNRVITLTELVKLLYHIALKNFFCNCVIIFFSLV